MKMFQAIYQDGLSIDETLCRSMAEDVNLNPDRLTETVNSGQALELHTNWKTEARKEGVFGVPTFVYRDKLFWGNDRLPLL